jgi:WD40 repeat protein
MIHDGPVIAVAFSPDGSKIASGTGGDDNKVYVWNSTTHREITHMVYTAQVSSVAFSPNNQWVVSGSHDGVAQVWDVTNGQEISRMTVDGSVMTIDLSSDGKLVAQGACEGQYVACGNAVVRIWESRTGKEVYQLKPDFAIRVVKFTPDNKNIVLAGDHGSIQLWNLDIGKMISEYEPDLTGAEVAGRAGAFIETMDVAPNGKWIVAGSRVAAEVWDLNSTIKIYKMNSDDGISAVTFSPSGKWVASASNNNIRVWDPQSGEELIVIPLQSYYIGDSSLAFSPDEKWLALGSGTMIKVWEISTGREISQLITSVPAANTSQPSLSNNSTLVPSETPSVVPTSKSQAISLAQISCADVEEVNLRKSAGYINKDDKKDVVREIPCGENVELLGENEYVDDFTWWKVNWNGYDGWIADHTEKGKIILIFNQSSSFSSSDPAEFIDWYFNALWQKRNYDVLWNTYLTSRFQNRSSPGGFKEFSDWWKTIKQIDVHSIDVLQNDGNNAWVKIQVTFYYFDGRILKNRSYEYDLTFDTEKKIWMFDYHN